MKKVELAIMPRRTVPNPFAWALCICLAAALISIIAFLLQQPPPHYRAEPAKSDYQNNKTAPGGRPASQPQSGNDTKKKANWYDTLREHPTDWFLVLFNGILAVYTAKLFIATSGLVEAAQEQSRDTKIALSISDKSAEAAKKAANAAEKTIEAAREAMHLDQRAWLGIETIRPDPLIPEAGKPFQAIVTIKNTGKTPARKIEGNAVIDPVQKDQQPNLSYAGDETFRIAFISPNGNGDLTLHATKNAKTGQIGPLLQAGFDQLASGQLQLMLHGRVHYEDIFGEPHWFTFCFSLNTPFDGRFGASPTGNDTDDYKPKKTEP